MPIPNTPKPAFPNVPIAPGVPSVPRAPGFVQAASSFVLLASDAANVLGLFSGPQWGLFNIDGSPAFTAFADIFSVGGIAGSLLASGIRLLGGGGQSILRQGFRNDNRVSTAPQEQGAFVSYNKVATPFQGRVTYVISGLAAARGAFLADVLIKQNSTNLFSLVMPEYTYPNCTIVHHDYDRSAREGVSMLSVEIWVEEVRITGTQQFSNTQAPSGASQVDGGTVQPQPPTPSQTPPPASPGSDFVFPPGAP